MRFAAENRRFLFFGFLLAFSSSFGQTFFIGVFGPEVRAEFGLSHGDWSLIYMIGTLMSALALPWTGRLIDRVDLRLYTAAAWGHLSEDSITIDAPIGRDPKDRRKMAVVADGRRAVTRARVRERWQRADLLDVALETGRTHQIRVHLAATGFPLAVDRTYGRRNALFLSEIKAGYKPKRGRRERPLVDRLTLHAAELVVPAREEGGEAVRVESPLPKDLATTLRQLDKVRRWLR